MKQRNREKIMTGRRDLVVRKLINALAELKAGPPLQNVENKVRYVLEAAYETGISRIEFNDEERRQIGLLIKDVIKPIDQCLFEVGYSFDHNQAASNLVLRSGLQFMLDNFKNFPISDDNSEKNNETLEDTSFAYLRDTSSIETFDQALINWKTNSGSLTEVDITFESEEISRPLNVPESHTWWF